MREVFYEESSSKVKTKTDKLKYYFAMSLAIALFFFAFIWFISNVFEISFSAGNILKTLLFIILPPVLAVVSGIFIIRLASNVGVDFDYTFISGTIKVAKVIMDSKRVPIITFETSDIELIGKTNSQTYENYSRLQGIKIEELTAKSIADDNKAFYYLIVNHESEKKMLIFECTDTFIKTILSYVNKRLLEEDFNKWYILTTQQQQSPIKTL